MPPYPHNKVGHSHSNYTPNSGHVALAWGKLFWLDDSVRTGFTWSAVVSTCPHQGGHTNHKPTHERYLIWSEPTEWLLWPKMQNI